MTLGLPWPHCPAELRGYPRDQTGSPGRGRALRYPARVRISWTAYSRMLVPGPCPKRQTCYHRSPFKSVYSRLPLGNPYTADVTRWSAGHPTSTAFVVTATSIQVKKVQLLEVKECTHLMVNGRQSVSPYSFTMLRVGQGWGGMVCATCHHLGAPEPSCCRDPLC